MLTKKVNSNLYINTIINKKKQKENDSTFPWITSEGKHGVTS